MDAYTISDLARQTGLTEGKIKTALKGITPTHTLNNGYYKLYSVEVLREELIRRNQDLLVALGFLPKEEVEEETWSSYSANIVDDEAEEGIA